MNLEDLYRLMRNSHVQAQSIIDTVPDPLLVLDRNLCIQTASRAFFTTFQVDRAETIGQHLYELGNRQWDIPELRLLLEDVIPKSMAVVDYEVEHDFPSIGRRTMLVSAQRLFHPDNNSRTLLLSIVDATKRRQREAEKDVLLDELRHRTKNLLAVVQAMTRQTTAAGRSGEEYREDLLGRLNALIVAHDAAFSNSRETETELKEMVEQTLEPYSEASVGILVESGPSVRLPPQQAVSLSLVLHELATNAIKYGALSNPTGQVRIHWEIEEASAPKLRLVWQESGGPPVAPPAVKGFGTKLIEFIATHELGGRVELNYAPAGLIVEIVAPLGSVS
ncbi:PAS domain-containing protein [Rhizobium sp. ARZ01]|uniref:sensor histidine kinase n=1 Tax=Rhizobium sp. ARZ01 TaxID=2769313 RepID=UPI00177EDF0C|nr:HWE histidine kinase domain-containing protein [Rhizobium sp. ARZ01]MBD9375183.1 PAS domain-containing protein [Rhizobium sp. ARZ01]